MKVLVALGIQNEMQKGLVTLQMDIQKYVLIGFGILMFMAVHYLLKRKGN